ncbi:MAG TPA: DUF1553 domain-containing protein [Pirellulales bacterium]|nr:DUF1553 domain-containing protein [Pirellulales bacterium]
MPTFNQDIRPILLENCFACHGPDSASRKADLRLDRRDAAVEATAITPGKPDESEMIRRITSTDPKKQMPPPAAKKTLTAAEKDTLRRWIAGGAEYQLHWSLIAPKKGPLPEVKNAAWVRNPIDRFILAKLEAAGLQPAAEADPRALVRRVSLDITGLPPAPAVVQQYLDDKSPDAYEKLLDRLFKSPQYGEHRARYWLDDARYADSNGIHFDDYREIWSYRDWVINAFNHNMPFDKFTIDQLAGDLIPHHTLDQQVATGFNRCNMTTNEGGAINEEYLVLYTRDRTQTTAATWLGISANCMVCHDHKFDPFTQKELYSFSAFFNNTTQAAMDGNVKNTPPVIPLARAEDRPRLAQLPGEIAAANKALGDRKQAAQPEFQQWLATVTANPPTTEPTTAGLKFSAPLSEGAGNTVSLTLDGKAQEYKVKPKVEWEAGKAAPKAFKSEPGAISLPEVGDFDHDHPYTAGAWIKISNLSELGAIFARMDDKNEYRGWDLWLQSGHIGSHLINKWPSNAVKVVSKATIKANEWAHVLVAYDGSQTAAGLKIYINGALQETTVEADALHDTTRSTVPFKVATRHTTGQLRDLAINDIRIYDRTLTPAEIETLAKSDRLGALLSIAADKRSEQDRNELQQWFLQNIDSPSKDLTAKLAALDKEQKEILARGTIAFVMQEKPEVPKAYVLNRGEYDQRKDEVHPGTFAALPPMPEDFPRTRLGLAKWIMLPDNPLTARVAVNRFWQEVFGTGIVKTAGDFGVAGELPSHQALIDWLAVEFRESGWNVQHMYKLILMSAAYRQAAQCTPEKLEKDPANRLLSRGPRFRMDAEMIRDNALASSGELVLKIGGPSVKPYQPDHIWDVVGMAGSDTRNYVADKGEGLYRRSLYTFWKRQAPPPSLDIFNAPSREICTMQRERTDTPLQALVILNDPQYVEAARNLAQHALQQGGQTVDTQLDYVAQRLLSRSFRPEEIKIITGSLDKLRQHYEAKVDDAKRLIAVGDSKADPALNPVQLASWTMVVSELMNLDEVLNK